MKPEDKQLLLKDLCARLPYKVIVEIKSYGQETQKPWFGELSCKDLDCFLHDVAYKSIKPYLRPMSSMTEEEKRELQSFFPGSFGGQWLNLEKGYIDIYECESTIRLYLYDATGLTEWLNKKMFDYRGLIPKGLAEIAPEGMYNT